MTKGASKDGGVGDGPTPSGPVGIRLRAIAGGNGDGAARSHASGPHAPDAGPAAPVPSAGGAAPKNGNGAHAAAGTSGGADAWIASALAPAPSAAEPGDPTEPLVVFDDAEPAEAPGVLLDSFEREVRDAVSERLAVESELARLRALLAQTQEAQEGKERLLLEREDAIAERDRRIASLEGELARALATNRTLRERTDGAVAETDERLRRLASGLESLEIMAHERREQVDKLRFELRAGDGAPPPPALPGIATGAGAAALLGVIPEPGRALARVPTARTTSASAVDDARRDIAAAAITAGQSTSRDELRARAAARIETQRLNTDAPETATTSTSAGPVVAGATTAIVMVRDQSTATPLVRAASRASQRIGPVDQVIEAVAEPLTASGVRRLRERPEDAQSRRVRAAELEREWKDAERRRRSARFFLMVGVFVAVVGFVVWARQALPDAVFALMSGGGGGGKGREVAAGSDGAGGTGKTGGAAAPSPGSDGAERGATTSPPPSPGPTGREARRAPPPPPAGRPVGEGARRVDRLPGGGTGGVKPDASASSGAAPVATGAAAELRAPVAKIVQSIRDARTDAQRRQAMREIVGAVEPGDLEALRALLASDPDDKVRAAVIKALAKIGTTDRAALDVVTDAIRYDRASEVRLEAVHAVRNVRHEDAVPVLDDIIANDRDSALRIAAIGAMKGMKQTGYARSLVIGYGNEETVQGRMQILKALGDVGGAEDIGFLEQIQNAATEAPVRAAAGAALSRVRRKLERGGEEPADPTGAPPGDGEVEPPKGGAVEAEAPIDVERPERPEQPPVERRDD